MPGKHTLKVVPLEEILSAHEKWWRDTLGRPIFHAIMPNQTSPVSSHGYVPRKFLPSYPRNTPVKEILNAQLTQLESQFYLADGFPLLWMNFGPGVLAAMTGGCCHASDETVWFSPGKFQHHALEEISIHFDPNSDWARWLSEFYTTAATCFAELPIVLGMTDLGGVLDVLASLRGTENLLMDLLDAPEEVKRLTGEEREAWFAAYRHFDALRRGPRSCWAAILSADPVYMLQSDFSYMISPELFAEFVQPELQQYAQHLSHSFYHLDGKQQIAHVPHLAEINGLAGIQWIPGDGQPPQCEWPELLSDLENRGLKIQLLGSLENVETALRRLKHPERVHAWMTILPEEQERAERLFADFGL